ncbi:MAG: ATP-binding cassette domain-containing protein, partial [Gammaproteobacteria bacterium]|nr:ATP-binding cassette domain-containing protein [Gammaproteobacteria bacterium]
IEGPNGCGKSTLLSLIDGENHKGYGQEVYLFGRRKGSGETVWEVKAHFGIVSNESHNKYVKGWKVLDVVVSGFYDSVGLYDDSGAAEWEVARRWLQALGIASFEKSYYHEISFGQQRLVLLARAMVKHPRVLILDEPCVGLDDYHRELILGMLDLIAQQTATQIVYVSHVLGEQPVCINQKLLFAKSKRGGYTLSQI